MSAIYAVCCNKSLFLWINAHAAFLDDRIGATITIFGDTTVAAALYAFFIGKKPGVLWAAILSGIIGALFTHTLKPLLDLPRPAGFFLPDSFHIIGQVLRKHAFPSGHALTVWALAGVIVLVYRLWWGSILLFVLASLVALSRIAIWAQRIIYLFPIGASLSLFFYKTGYPSVKGVQYIIAGGSFCIGIVLYRKLWGKQFIFG